MRHYALLTCLLLPLESIAVPLTWGDGNGHAYEVVLASNISWSAAQAAATARGGRLATIGSSAENEFVFALANGVSGAWRSTGGAEVVGPWLGGIQAAGASEPAGSWGWVTGEAFVFTRWGSGQPNDNRTTAPGGNQDRIAFGNARDGAWGDFQDSYGVNAYVVEYDRGVRTRWDANGHEYEVVRSSNIGWNDAAARAVAMGGHLVTIGSAAENGFVGSLIRDLDPIWTRDEFGIDVGPWLGGVQVAGSDEPTGGWTWIDGTGPLSYTNWNAGQPNDNRTCCTGGNQDRLHVYTSDRSNMAWGDYQAGNALRGFVVEYSAPVPEPGTAATTLIGLGLITTAVFRRRIAATAVLAETAAPSSV